jgi:hypothetical protein
VTSDPSDRLLFFAYRQPPSSTGVSVYFSPSAIRLPSFGFESNGTYEINLSLPGFAVAWERRDHPRDPGLLCFNKSHETTTWSGIIPTRGTFIPLIAACSQFSGDLFVITNYTNPSGGGDYREKYTFELLRILGCIYPFFSFCWYLNCRFHPEFFIDIHHYMTLLPLLKSGVLFLEAELYRKRRIDPVDVAWSLIASVLVHSSLFTVLTCAAAGWCTYADRVKAGKVVSAMILSFSFFASSALGNYYRIFVSVTSVTLFVGLVVIAGMASKIVIRWLRSTDEVLTRKYEMVLYFMFNVVVVCSGMGIANVVARLHHFWAIVRLSIIEGGCLALFVLQMRFFFYRQDHIPAYFRKGLREAMSHPKLAVIVEPTSHRLFAIN